MATRVVPSIVEGMSAKSKPTENQPITKSSLSSTTHDFKSVVYEASDKTTTKPKSFRDPKPETIETDVNDKGASLPSDSDSMIRSENIDSQTPINKTSSSKPKKRKKILLVSLMTIGICIVLILGLVAFTYFQAKPLIDIAKTTKSEVEIGAQALKQQDLVTGKQHLQSALDSMQAAQSQYGKLAYLQFTPARWHYQDGLRVINSAQAGIEAGLVLVNAVEPYADVIGFSGQGSFMGGTAEDRIVKVVETLDKVNPSLDEIQQKIHYIRQELDGINPNRYPIPLSEFNLTGLPTDVNTVADAIALAKASTHQLESLLNDAKPAIEQLPKIAGIDEPKTYLILFQNNGELRPTGGFLTAYAIVKVDKGKVTAEKSDDIYELDNKLNLRLPAPAPIEKYLDGVYYWNLRDMNLDPDFKLSMDQFTKYYTQVPGEPKIDGVVSVDTHLLSSLIQTLGPIDVPGYGVFSAETEPACDCPQVVYALENMITKPTPYHRSDRKGVLGPLMQTIMQKAFGAPKQVYTSLFKTIIDNINQKHVMFYMFDPSAQEAAERINVAGRIRTTQADYFHLNDSNFGGAKSNMFVTQEVDQQITLTEAGDVQKTVTLTYKNPRAGDNCNLEAGQLCLNGVLPNWTQIYLPKGSKLQESLGFNEGTVSVDDVGDHTVIQGFFKLNPQAQVKIKLTYIIPYKPTNEYQLYLQKQPGKENPHYTITINNEQQQEFDLLTDKEISFDL